MRILIRNFSALRGCYINLRSLRSLTRSVQLSSQFPARRGCSLPVSHRRTYVPHPAGIVYKPHLVPRRREAEVQSSPHPEKQTTGT